MSGDANEAKKWEAKRDLRGPERRCGGEDMRTMIDGGKFLRGGGARGWRSVLGRRDASEAGETPQREGKLRNGAR